MSIAVEGFWPVLFSYRKKDCLQSIEGEIGDRSGNHILASILSDAFFIYGIKTICITKRAFVLKVGDLFEITGFRKPTTAIAPLSIPRLNRPTFSIRETKQDIYLSLHESYIQLFPSPPLQVTIDNTIDDDSDDEVEEEDEMELDFSNSILSHDLTTSIEDDDEPLSQTFSVFSLEDSDEEEFFLSPAHKKVKLADFLSRSSPNKIEMTVNLDIKSEKDTFSQRKDFKCDLCGVHIGSKSNLTKHQLKSCPESPHLDKLTRLKIKQKIQKKKTELGIDAFGEYVVESSKYSHISGAGDQSVCGTGRGPHCYCVPF